MRTNDLTPAYPTHPGEMLKDEIEHRGISQRKLADKTGFRYTAANEILNGHKPLTEKVSLRRLHAFLDVLLTLFCFITFYEGWFSHLFLYTKHCP